MASDGLPSWDETTSEPPSGLRPSEGPPIAGMPKGLLPSYEETTATPPPNWAAGPERAPTLPSYEETSPEPPTPPPDPNKPVTPKPDSEPREDQAVPLTQIARSAYSRKLAERAAFDVTGARIALPQGVGGMTLQESLPTAPPETKDYVDKLLGQTLPEGWTNYQWWVAQLAGAGGGLTPGLAGAGAATLAGGPLAGIAAFGIEAGLGALVPAYQAAVQAGDPHPIRRAIMDSGIAVGFAGLMGISGKIPASALGGLVSESVAEMLERPIAEALFSLGIVGPGLAGAQDVVTAMSHGEAVNWPQTATDMVIGGLAGLGVHEVVKNAARARTAVSRGEQKPASEETIAKAAEAQAARPPGFESRVREAHTEPAAPVAIPTPDQPDYPEDGGFYRRDLEPLRKSGSTGYGGTEPDAFYNKLDAAVDDLPKSVRPEEVIPHLLKKGITEAELGDTFIPQYLKDVTSGRLNKSAIQSWVESQKLQVWERKDPEGRLGDEQVAFRSADVTQDLATADVNYTRDRDGHWTMAVEDFSRSGEQAPFKTGLEDLAAKRLMQLAANRGVTRLAFDDKTNPALAEALRKQAKMLGEKGGETKLPDQPEVKKYVDIHPKMAENVYKHGQAMYDADPAVKAPRRGKTLSDYVQTNPVPDHLKLDMAKIGDAINAIANHIGVTRPIEFVQEQNPKARYRGYLYKGVNPATGNYRINVNLHRLMNRNELYASMSHEFGHVIKENVYSREPDSVKAALRAGHDAWLALQSAPDRMVGEARRGRDNAISLLAGGRAMHDHYKLTDLVQRSRDYFLSYDEYFAEQTAKWMQTDEKPLGIVDKFFKRLGNVIRQAVTKFRQMQYGGKADPDAAIKEWLNRKFGAPTEWLAPHEQQFDQDTVRKAQAAFDREGAPETRAVPMQGSSAGGRGIIAGLPPEVRGNGGEAMPAHADRMNWFYKWALSLPQIQRLNQHIGQLAEYLGMHRTANVEKNEIMTAAFRRLEQWSRITDKKQLYGLTNFIQDYAHMDHRPDPATSEFRDMVKKHDLSEQSVKLFQGLQEDFDGFLNKNKTLLINNALKLKDPAQRANNLQNINTKFDEMAKRPFFPIAHFGKYMVQVFDSQGNIVHQEHTNSLRRQKQIVEILEKSIDRLPGDKVLPGMVPKDVQPFVGLPPGMIDLIGDKLNLSQTQRGALDQLRFDYAPAQTFKHQYRNLDLVPGYSTDFQRAYAHFFFHGANHLTRIRWVDAMRDQITSLGSDQERLARLGDAGGANKLDMIVKYMQNHFDNWVDPKSDWAALKGLMFHVYLGMSPAAAATNLTQTALSTYPWLASKYGDIGTIRALTKASFDLNNFYRKGTILEQAKNAPPGPEGAWARAAAQLINEGTITESQAHQLAAVSEDRNLLRAFGNKSEKFWLKFQEASSWMFDLSEQYNRRVAARAAWELAMKAGPDHAAVKEAIAQDPILWRQLTDNILNGGKGWSKQEASAFLAAKHAVEATQFEYQPYARPAFMQGKKGSLFIFKQFTQNMLFNLASNPGMLARWMVVMGALGGIGGLAGYDNVNSIIKTIAARVFGKDFDLDDEVRHFAHDVLNDGIQPDVLLHGMSVKGFGIPHVMHSMGANWFPTVDMSRSVGMGDVLGFDPMKLMMLAPSTHPKEEELRQVSRASGAAFGMLPSLFDFASSNENFGQLKKYEPIMPHWMGSLSHAYRWATQGRETNQAGNTVIRFNPADTEHMSEIFARALGFQPRRYTEEIERTQALKESSDYYDLRKQVLMRQFGDAVKNRDDDGKETVVAAIRHYNEQLPDEARGKAISGKELKASVQQRLRVAAKQEAGIPLQKSNIPLQREMEPYYPRGWPKDQVGAKPVQ
jgi:hypothetical protein